MRFFVIALSLAGLTACTPPSAPPSAPAPETTLPFFGDGYPAAGDPCRRLGESAETINYLDHTADLVGCPAGTENLGTFVASTAAQEVFRQDGYVIYTVPRP